MAVRSRANLRKSRQALRLAVMVGTFAAATARAGNLDTIGLGNLVSIDPTLTGAGVRVAQVEADVNGNNSNSFAVNPGAVAQPANLFTYINESGAVVPFASVTESSHADVVGDIFYGGGASGIAPGVSHVDNYAASYFANTIIPRRIGIIDEVVNQSFIFGTAQLSIAQQQREDTIYDNYAAVFGTLFVSAAGNGSPRFVQAPATAYNSIAVTGYPGTFSTGPTVDNQRAKPDITAPGGESSFTTPLVSGAAALLIQAGTRGDGGTGAKAKADSVDWRAVKALLLNGADKQTISFSRTNTMPLDLNHGAGMLNVYNAYQQLAAGEFGPGSVSSTAAVGGAHPADTSGPLINSLSGWNLGTLTSTSSSDVYANYLFSPSAGVNGYNFSATLAWGRHFNSNVNAPIGINNLDLFLIDTTNNTTIDFSASTVDNVEVVYDQNLTPGDVYDLQVLKNGGNSVISNAETYALAFSFTSPSSAWISATSGSWGDSGNWENGIIPQHAGDAANFYAAITGAAAVALDGDRTVGSINFNNTNSYTITSGSGGSLVLDKGGASATIIDFAGSHAIAAPMVLNSNAAITVARAGDVLTLSGPISGAGGIGVAGHGTLRVSSPATLSSLTVGVGSTLDIVSAGLTINFASPASDPVAAIVANLTAGYNGGTWTGVGIVSSTAAASIGNGTRFTVGYADGNADAGYQGNSSAANQVIIKYTISGDANLDGKVDIADLAVIAQNYNLSGKDYAHGNLIYDPNGLVGLGDLALIAQNYSKSVGAGIESAGFSPYFLSQWRLALLEVGNTPVTPEPGGASLMVIGIWGLMARRRRINGPHGKEE